MPPTHPSQADVAAAYRTLIAHETEPKEQDFYRDRLQRLEQATEPECEFDCRSRVAAAGVGVYCPQCSAKCADTDLATQLAKAIRAAWVDRLDWDELAHAALKFLTSTGRLVSAGGMALTAEQVEDVRTMLWSPGVTALDAFRRLRALFPATEPAEATINSMLKVPASEEVSGNNVAGCNSSTGREDVQTKKITRAWMLHLGYSEDHVDSLEQATHEGYGCEHNPFGGWDCIDESGDSQHQDWDEYDNTAQIVMFVLERIPGVTSAEPAKEETNAQRCPFEIEGWGCSLTNGHDGDHTAYDQDGPAYVWPASSPVVPATTETEFERGVRAGINEYRLYFLDENEGAIYAEVPVAELDRAAEGAIAGALRDNANSVNAAVPTEPGPWETWQEVPDGVKYESGAKYWGAARKYVNRSGVRMAVVNGEEYPSTTDESKIQGLAPFVAAEEG